jgi:hypothetical protein
LGDFPTRQENYTFGQRFENDPLSCLNKIRRGDAHIANGLMTSGRLLSRAKLLPGLP